MRDFTSFRRANIGRFLQGYRYCLALNNVLLHSCSVPRIASGGVRPLQASALPICRFDVRTLILVFWGSFASIVPEFRLVRFFLWGMRSCRGSLRWLLMLDVDFVWLVCESLRSLRADRCGSSMCSISLRALFCACGAFSIFVWSASRLANRREGGPGMI